MISSEVGPSIPRNCATVKFYCQGLRRLWVAFGTHVQGLKKQVHATASIKFDSERILRLVDWYPAKDTRTFSQPLS